MKVLWDKLKKLLKWILPIGGVLTFLIQFASGWYEGHADKLIIQCSIENNKVGFSTDGEYRAVILKLHPQMIITKVLIDYYQTELSSFYQNGANAAETPIAPDDPQEYSDKRMQVKDVEADNAADYLIEFGLWNYLYQYSGQPVDLYQSQRSLRDALDKGGYEDSEDLLLKTAEIVYRSEKFLTYGDRNINPEKEAIYINAEDIAFENGKLYDKLVDRLSIIGSVEEQQYSNSYLVIAYVLMHHAEELMEEENEKYAVVCYYIGNIGEQILSRISKESSIYAEIGDEVLAYYRKAKMLLESGREYKKEAGMSKNIENGIDTVSGLLGK